MSSTLHMQPVPRLRPKSEQLSFYLKKVIARRFWEHDGSLSGDKVRIEYSDLAVRGYLEGLVDAGVEDAEELLTAVVQHGAVDVWIAS